MKINLSNNSKIIFILCLITVSPLLAQTKIYLYGAGGVNYLPMKSFSHFLNELSNSKMDDIGFNGEIGLRYNIINKHNIGLFTGINNKNASFSGGFGGANWNIRIFPIAIGYDFTFGNEKENKFLTNVGLNLSYNFIQIDEKSYSDIGGHNPNDFYKMNKFGVAPYAILTFKLYENLSLLGKFEYKFIDDIELWSQELNLSGITLNVGLQIKLFNAI